MSEKLPIGTRIVFLKDLTEGPSDEHPGRHYASKGDGGVVTGHDCREGHWVKWDKWPAPFGAELGTEFTVQS
jgi:hypothetical protein